MVIHIQDHGYHRSIVPAALCGEGTSKEIFSTFIRESKLICDAEVSEAKLLA